MQELWELKSTQTPFAKLRKHSVKVLSPNMPPWKPDDFLYRHPHLLVKRGKLSLREISELSRASELVPSLGASLEQGLCVSHIQPQARHKAGLKEIWMNGQARGPGPPDIKASPANPPPKKKGFLGRRGS